MTRSEGNPSPVTSLRKLKMIKPVVTDYPLYTLYNYPLCNLSKDKESYAEKLFGQANFGINTEEKPKLVVFFDNEEITEGDCPNFDNWKNKGFYIPLHAGYHEMPVRLSDMFDWREYKHFIWIRNDICAGENDVEFAWTLAHELRHFEQDILSHALSELGFFLYRNLSNVPEHVENYPAGIPIIEVPRERDAELYAWRRILDLFDNEDLIDKYMRQDKSLVHLLGCDPNSSYALVQETIAVINRHKDTFSELARSQNFNLEKWANQLEGIGGKVSTR